MSTEEWEIIQKINSGDNQLYETLVLKYEKPLFNFILQILGNYHSAQDVTQECFIKAYKGLSEFKPKAKLFTWLYKIAQNLCIDYLRKNKSNFLQFDANLINDPSTDDFNTTDFQNDLKFFIMQLSIELRTVFYLRTFHDFTYEEMADILNIPVGTVRSRLARARDFLQEKLVSYVKIEGREVSNNVL